MSRLSTSGTALAEVLLDGFVGYLRSERGVTALTVEAYVSDVRRFLAHRGDSDVRGLTAAEVSNTLLARSASGLRRRCVALGAGFARSCATAIWPAWSIRTCQRRRCRCRDGAGRCFPKASLRERPSCCWVPVTGAGL